MPIELCHQLWLVVARHVLPEIILIVSGALSSELVRGCLIVVRTQMAQDPWGHVSMVRAGSHSWEQHRTGLLMALSSHEPAWENNA